MSGMQPMSGVQPMSGNCPCGVLQLVLRGLLTYGHHGVPAVSVAQHACVGLHLKHGLACVEEGWLPTACNTQHSLYLAARL